MYYFLFCLDGISWEKRRKQIYRSVKTQESSERKANPRIQSKSSSGKTGQFVNLWQLGVWHINTRVYLNVKLERSNFAHYMSLEFNFFKYATLFHTGNVTLTLEQYLLKQISWSFDLWPKYLNPYFWLSKKNLTGSMWVFI